MSHFKTDKNRRKQTNKFRLETGNVGNSLYMYVRYPVGHVGGLTSAHGSPTRKTNSLWAHENEAYPINK